MAKSKIYDGTNNGVAIVSEDTLFAEPPKEVLMNQPESNINAPDIQPESVFVYLGPSIRGCVLSGAILQGDYEDVEQQLKTAIDKYPLVRNLLVSIGSIVEDRVNVETPGNVLYEFYSRLEKQIMTEKQGG